MITQKIKTMLLRVFGEKPVAFLQAVRFIFLTYAQTFLDPEVALLPLLARKGDAVVDVGANGANWTYWLHRNVGKTGYVYAFEADPYYALATDIAIRLMRLRGVRLFPFGLSNQDEEAPLAISDADGLRLSGMSHIDRTADSKNARQIVQLRRLDSLIEDFPRLAAVKLIKCDVEGYELFVFRGATEILERSRPFVILEIGHFELHGYSAVDVFDFFSTRNYEAFAMIDERTLARTDRTLEHKNALSVNRLMIPTEQLSILAGRIQIVE